MERSLDPIWLERGPDDKPLPPPADFPLRPRPRGSEYLRWFCERAADRYMNPTPHTIPGPPYSLVVVDNPDASNAFSYGFGPDGGGGVVVYSGFLDDVLSHSCEATPKSAAPKQTSWLSYLLGGFSLSTPPPSHPVPTPEQTSELAILLAHELAHLVLSHHLETLSSVTIMVPGVLSILSDTIRALLFPITMIFGPFVNDAVAQMGKVGSGEISKIGDYCTSVHQEIEADVVSARSAPNLSYIDLDSDRLTIVDSLPTQVSMRAKPSNSGKLDGRTRLRKNVQHLVPPCLQNITKAFHGG